MLEGHPLTKRFQPYTPSFHGHVYSSFDQSSMATAKSKAPIETWCIGGSPTCQYCWKCWRVGQKFIFGNAIYTSFLFNRNHHGCSIDNMNLSTKIWNSHAPLGFDEHCRYSFNPFFLILVWDMSTNFYPSCFVEKHLLCRFNRWHLRVSCPGRPTQPGCELRASIMLQVTSHQDSIVWWLKSVKNVESKKYRNFYMSKKIFKNLCRWIER